MSFGAGKFVAGWKFVAGMEVRRGDGSSSRGWKRSGRAAVSRAPIGKIEAFRRRMGRSFPWRSSLGSDFNYDFPVTHDQDVAPVEYHFKTTEELIEAGQE